MACVAFVRNYDAQGVVGTYPLVKGFCWYVIIFMGNSLSQAVEIRSLIADVTFPPSLCMQETFGQQSLSMLFFWLLEPPFCWSKLVFGGASFWGLAEAEGPKSWFETKKTCVFLAKWGCIGFCHLYLGVAHLYLTVNPVTCPGKTGVTLQIPLRTKNWLRRKLQEYPLKRMQSILGVTSEVKSE